MHIKITKKRILLAALVSLLIHLVFMYTMTGSGDGKGNQPGSGANKPQPPIKIVIKGSDQKTDKKVPELKPAEDTKSKVVQPKKKKKPKPKKIVEDKPKGRDCEKDGWYGGIGIVMAGQFVGETYEGYPAHKNGLMKGDLIIEPSDGQIRGEPGSTINMKILRGSQLIIKNFKREKICYTARI